MLDVGIGYIPGYFILCEKTIGHRDDNISIGCLVMFAVDDSFTNWISSSHINVESGAVSSSLRFNHNLSTSWTESSNQCRRSNEICAELID